LPHAEYQHGQPADLREHVFPAGRGRTQSNSIEQERTVVTNELSSGKIDQLLSAARAATTHAYVPYSDFPVGAAVLTESGEIISGVNIENASFGLTVCGERVAVQTAAALGHRTILAVAVSAPRSAGTTPCGACRQVLNEFRPEEGDMVVILDGEDGPIVHHLGDLLPQAFGPRNLA
jgi:cytidine deaminase